jgi:hypothetical protein
MRNRFSSHLFPRIELEQKYSRQQGLEFFHAPPLHPPAIGHDCHKTEFLWQA